MVFLEDEQAGCTYLCSCLLLEREGYPPKFRVQCFGSALQVGINIKEKDAGGIGQSIIEVRYAEEVS